MKSYEEMSRDVIARINEHEEKVKKQDGDLSIPLQRTQDILAWLGQNRRPGQKICGFSMETENLLANSSKKLEKKKEGTICVF